MNDLLTFGSWLRERRKELDLTQFDLADRVGCSEDTIQKIERGERRPSKQFAHRLAEVLEIPLDEQTAFVVAARGGNSPQAQPTGSKAATTSADVSIPTNLPTPLTPLIGREEAVAHASDYLRNGVRLLTLTGAPGVGKTRLSLQVASDLLPDFEGGVFLVELAPITDPDLVAPTIAGALGLRDRGSLPVFEALKVFLKDHGNGRRLLLLLDNFEQILDAAPVVVQLLSAAPQLTVLVTSREALHVIGEQQLPVQPLRVPDLSRLDDLPNWRSSSEFPAVELFVQRARAGDPHFRLTEDNYRDVAEISIRLEGLPLAIELTAACIKIFPPRALLARLRSSVNIVTRGARSLPQRQQTLKNAIQWSYELLSNDEKKLFRRLAVFSGGRTIEAVEAVCSAGDSLGIDVVDGLTSLVEKSLLRREEGVGGEPRFVMLEMIQEYARDKLQESGEQEAMRRAHALYFTGLAEETNPKDFVTIAPDWLNRLEEEHDNLRAAIQWCHSAGGDIEIELRLVRALGIFWDVRGHLSEGRERLASALSRPESRQDRFKSLRAWSLMQLGGLEYWQSDFHASRSTTEEALSLFREISDLRGIARALTDLGAISTAEGDHEKSIIVTSEALQICRELDDQQRISLLQILIGWSRMYMGDYAQAAAQLEEALKLAQDQAMPNRIALALTALGEVRMRQGHLEEAVYLLEQALASRRNMGHRSYIAAILGVLGLAAIRQADYGRATERLAESLTIRKEIGDKGGIAWCLEKFAQTMRAHGEHRHLELAAHLLGAASALREALGTGVDTVDRADYDQTVLITQERLGQEAFMQCWQQGRSMTIEQAVQYALSGENLDLPEHPI